MAESYEDAKGCDGNVKIERIFYDRSCMSAYRTVKHFVVSWENGKLLISRAREIIPNRTYEIIKDPKPYVECFWTPEQPQYAMKAVKGIGLGERAKINSTMS